VPRKQKIFPFLQAYLMKEQRSLLSSSAVHVVSCNHFLSKSVCQASFQSGRRPHL